MGSNDKLSDNGNSSDNWMYGNNKRPKGFKMPFTEELSQVLAESKGSVVNFYLFFYLIFLIVFFYFCFSRRTGDGASRESSDDYTELNRPQNPAAILTQNLVVEIRQAVNENQPKGILLILINFINKKKLVGRGINNFFNVLMHFLILPHFIYLFARRILFQVRGPDDKQNLNGVNLNSRIKLADAYA